MIRQTGGLAVGAISTRSSSAASALRDRVGQRNDSELLAVDTDQANFGGVDFAVDPLLLVQSYCGFSIMIKKIIKAATTQRPFARRDLLRRRASKVSRRHRAEILAAAGAHGHRVQPPAPYRRRSADKAAFAGYVPEFYRLFSHCANRSPRAARPPAACPPRPARRTPWWRSVIVSTTACTGASHNGIAPA